MHDAGWNSGSAFMLNMAETLTGLKHHCMEERQHVGSPVEDKDVGLLMKGLQRRIQVPVKKKPAMSRKNILSGGFCDHDKTPRGGFCSHGSFGLCLKVFIHDIIVRL